VSQPLFQSVNSLGTVVTERALNRHNAWAAIRKRAKNAGFQTCFVMNVETLRNFNELIVGAGPAGPSVSLASSMRVPSSSMARSKLLESALLRRLTA
jgi:hypothetical protein